MGRRVTKPFYVDYIPSPLDVVTFVMYGDV